VSVEETIIVYANSDDSGAEERKGKEVEWVGRGSDESRSIHLRRWRPFVAGVPPTLESFRTLESIRRWHLYVAGIYKPLGSIWKGA
jgi:hypothetical protein